MALPIFPALVGLTFPAVRTPTWSTDKMQSVTGRRNNLARFSYPVWSYELAYDVLRSDITNKEWQTLLAFYNRNYGPANVWQFTDPDDGSVATQLFGTGDGVTTAFQLVRTMAGANPNSFVEPVWAPTASTIYVNGVLNVANVVSSTGLVTFNAAPAAAAALTWTGTYNWLCRFDEDTLSVEKFAANFWELKSIKFSTEKL